MIQLIIDYLWHDAHACSEITKSLIKHLGANHTRDDWNTWVTHLIRKAIKDSSTTSFRKHEHVGLGYWSLLVEDILQIPYISQDLHGSNIGMWTYILQITSMKRLNFSSSTGFFA
jgi:hypothetical protein